MLAPKTKRTNVSWLALITAFCWGAGSFFGKTAMKVGNLSPLVGIILRTALALVLFLLLLLIFGRKLNVSLIKELQSAWSKAKIGLLQIVLFEGVLAGTIGMFLYYLSLSRGELSLVMPLAFLSPIFGTLFALLSKDEKLSFNRFAGLLFSALGIAVISSRVYSFAELFKWRIEYLALLVGFCWGTGSFFGKRGMKKAEISPLVGITLRTFTALVLLSLLVGLFGPNLFDSFIISEISWIIRNKIWQFLLILLFEGLLAGFLGMLFYYTAIRKGQLSLVMPLAFTSPFWGALLAALSGSELLTVQRVTGMILILAGIMYTTSPNFIQLLLSDRIKPLNTKTVNKQKVIASKSMAIVFSSKID